MRFSSGTAYVPLGYEYDLSCMFGDLVGLLRTLTTVVAGETVIDRPSDTFAVRWRLAWAGGVLKIHGEEWRGVLGGTESLLRAKPSVELATDRFVAERRAPLEIVERAVSHCAVNLRGLDELRELLASIPIRGSLYSRE